MIHTALVALRTVLVTMLLTGLAYPLAITGVAQLAFPRQAAGSLVTDERGNVVGSALVGQRVVDDRYLHGRPSAAGEDGYDASASSGSNLGPSSAELQQRFASDLARLRERNPDAGPVPAELLAASGSGLDPHVSPEAAQWQAPRIARARGIAVDRVRALIVTHTEDRTLGWLGEPRVNVLLVNLALDRTFGR